MTRTQHEESLECFPDRSRRSFRDSAARLVSRSAAATQRCRACPAGNAYTRRVLQLIAQAARERSTACPGQTDCQAAISRWTPRYPSIAESVEHFLPTAIVLKPLEWEDEPSILKDIAGDRFTRFHTAYYLVEKERHRAIGRIKLQAARCYLAPPCLEREAAERMELMARFRRGVPVPGEDGGSYRPLLGRLRSSELALCHNLSPSDQIALTTILAAREEPAAFLSSTGEWPSHSFLLGIANRLEVPIVRFSFEGLPDNYLRFTRYARYDAGWIDRGARREPEMQVLRRDLADAAQSRLFDGDIPF